MAVQREFDMSSQPWLIPHMNGVEARTRHLASSKQVDGVSFRAMLLTMSKYKPTMSHTLVRFQNFYHE